MTAISREAADAEYARREALYQLARESACNACGRGMDVRTVGGELKMLCPADPTHEGYRKRRSLSQMVRDGDAIDPFVSARLQRKKEEQMEPENRELALYGSERLPISQGAAEKIIRRLWPKASDAAAGHAMLLAVQENLNPLNHEIYIVPFKNRDGSVSEVVVLGIEANRKMARRRMPYSYKDGPRPLTAQEMEDIGEDPKQKIGVICVLETPAGAIFPGYGFWPKAVEPYGADKGNTKFNMASYRAERNALKRIMPDAELPAPVENVIDGVYADITEIVEAPKLSPPAARPTKPATVPPPAEAPQKPAQAGGEPAPANTDSAYDMDLAEVQTLKAKAGLTDAQLANRIRNKFENKSFKVLSPDERGQVKAMLTEVIASLAAATELGITDTFD